LSADLQNNTGQVWRALRHQNATKRRGKLAAFLLC